MYSRVPEIETADLPQAHADLNLYQFQTDCLLRINSSTAILNYLKLYESILGIVTILTNEKYLYFTLLKTFINWYVMHSLFFNNDEGITWKFKNLFHYFRALNGCFNYFWLLFDCS